MKFYRDSRKARFGVAAVWIFLSFYALHRAVRDHHWDVLAIAALGAVQIYNLWTQYWEIDDKGVVHCRSFGFRPSFLAVNVRYAGPVRKDVGFLFRPRKILSWR